MSRHGFVLGLVSLAFASAFDSAAAQDSQVGDASSTWRFESANDAIADSDNQFTNGFSLQKHGPTASSLAETGGTAAFGKGLAKFFLPDRNDMYYREGWMFGHNMQTPDAIEDPNIILNDVPYMGMLGWNNSFIAFNDQRMSGFSWMIGVTGEYSFAEELQSAVHSLIDSEDPEGWEHQLDNEPVLGFYYIHKRKLWRKPSFDGAVSFGAGASNFVSGAGLGLEMRFGRLPEGFAYIPDPIGVAVGYNATIPLKDQTAIYGTLSLRGRGLLVNMPREGNTFVSGNEWTDDNVIEPEDFIGVGYAGFHVERPKWALRIHLFVTTDAVDDSLLPPDQDAENSGGTLTYEWRFD